MRGFNNRQQFYLLCGGEYNDAPDFRDKKWISYSEYKNEIQVDCNINIIII